VPAPVHARSGSKRLGVGPKARPHCSPAVVEADDRVTAYATSLAHVCGGKLTFVPGSSPLPDRRAAFETSSYALAPRNVGCDDDPMPARRVTGFVSYFDDRPSGRVRFECVAFAAAVPFGERFDRRLDFFRRQPTSPWVARNRMKSAIFPGSLA